MSLHTKAASWLAIALGFAVVAMAFISVERGILPELACELLPYAVLSWPLVLVSYALDLIGER